MLLLPLVVAVACASPVFADDPQSTVTLTLPKTTLQLKLDYRQLDDANLAHLREVAGQSPEDLHRLQVNAIFAAACTVTSDVSFKIGEHGFVPGSHQFGFTIGTGGELHLVSPQGQTSVMATGVALEPSWNSPCLTMQLVFVSRSEARLVCHAGTRAWAFKLDLAPRAARGAAGGADAPKDPAPAKPADGAGAGATGASGTSGASGAAGGTAPANKPAPKPAPPKNAAPAAPKAALGAPPAQDPQAASPPSPRG